MSSVLGVGVGLYLALAVIQVVGAGGMTRLRRKAGLLREVVITNRLDRLRAEVSKIDAELLRLELRLEGLSNKFFKVAFFFLVLSIAGVGVGAFAPDLLLGCYGSAALVFFYLILPIIMFLVGSGKVSSMCKQIQDDISSAEANIIDSL